MYFVELPLAYAVWTRPRLRSSLAAVDSSFR